MNHNLVPTKREWVNAPLQYICSARVRLDDEQRHTLKAAYEQARKAATPAASAALMPGSTITVGTEYSINTQLSMPDMLIRDLLNSRDTIHLPALIQLQNALGVEVVTPDVVMKAFEGYLSHVFQTDDKE